MDATPLCLFWEGFTVAHHEFLDPQTLRLQLEPDDRVPLICSDCDHACFLVHDVHHRRVREAPLLIYRVALEVPVRRLDEGAEAFAELVAGRTSAAKVILEP